MKNLIGRKVKGGKFEGIDGEIGIIKRYNEFNNSYDIIFPKFIWRCPAEEIENYLEKEKNMSLNLTLQNNQEYTELEGKKLILDIEDSMKQDARDLQVYLLAQEYEAVKEFSEILIRKNKIISNIKTNIKGGGE